MPSTRPATGCFMPSTRRPEGNLAPPTPRAGCVPQARHAGGAGMEARHAARRAAALPVAVDRGGLPDSAEAGPPRAACTEPTPGVRGAVSPTGRRAQTGQHNRDRLGLSELWAVTRVRGAQPDPHPASASAPCTTRPHRGRASAGGHGRRRPPWTQRQRPQPSSSSSSSRTQKKTRCWSRPRRPVSRIEHFHATLDTASSSRRCRNGWTRTGSRRRPPHHMAARQSDFRPPNVRRGLVAATP